jgi:hypothetical protein
VWGHWGWRPGRVRLIFGVHQEWPSGNGPGNLGGTPEVPTRSREDAVAISDNQLSQHGGPWLPLGERRVFLCAPSSMPGELVTRVSRQEATMRPVFGHRSPAVPSSPGRQEQRDGRRWCSSPNPGTAEEQPGPVWPPTAPGGSRGRNHLIVRPPGPQRLPDSSHRLQSRTGSYRLNLGCRRKRE